MRRLGLAVLAAATLAASGCATIKPYEKEYLLNPLMDDAAVNRLKPSLTVSSAAQFERLGAAAMGSESSSCPTCGG